MLKRPFIFYGWFIVGAGIISYALGYGARYSFSVIFPSLLAEFQWPRDTTAVMLSVHLLVYGFFAPVAGTLVDRIGPRRAMAFGTVLDFSTPVISRSQSRCLKYVSFKKKNATVKKAPFFIRGQGNLLLVPGGTKF